MEDPSSAEERTQLFSSENCRNKSYQDRRVLSLATQKNVLLPLDTIMAWAKNKWVIMEIHMENFLYSREF